VSLRLYMDVHTPLAITDALRRKGVDVVTAQEDGSRRLDERGDRCLPFIRANAFGSLSQCNRSTAPRESRPLARWS
jgi:hypothetical protein